VRSTDEEVSGEGEKDLVEIWEAQVEKLLEANKRLEAERDLMAERLDRLKAEGRETIDALQAVANDKQTEIEKLHQTLQQLEKEADERKPEETKENPILGGASTPSKDAEEQQQQQLHSMAEKIRQLEAEKRELEESLVQLDEENALVRQTLIQQRDQLKERLNQSQVDKTAKDGDEMEGAKRKLEEERSRIKEEKREIEAEQLRLEDEERKVEEGEKELEKEKEKILRGKEEIEKENRKTKREIKG